MFDSIKRLAAFLPLFLSLPLAAQTLTNTVTFNFQDVLQGAWKNKSVTIESISTPRTNPPYVAVNFYLQTNSGTLGTFTLNNLLDGTYRISAASTPRPTTFLIYVPTNNPGTHYISDLLTTNIVDNATTAYTKAQGDARYVLQLSGRATNLNVSNINFTLGNTNLGTVLTRGTNGLPYWQTNSGGGGGGSGTLTNVLVGRSLYVMSNGTDASAQRLSLVQPYATLLHASSNAVAGDTIFVSPGTNFVTTNFLKSGLGVVLEPQSVIFSTNTPPFNDLNLGATAISNAVVSGWADVLWRPLELIGSYAKLANFTNAGSDVSLNVRDLIAEPQVLMAGTTAVVGNGNGARVDVRARDIIMNSSVNEASYISEWRGDGPMSINARHLRNDSPNTASAYGVVWAGQSTNAHMYVNAQSLTADFPIYGQTVSGGEQARSWINIQNIVSTENEVFWNVGAGFLYVTGQKAFTPTDMFRFTGTSGMNYLTFQKFEGGTSSQGGGVFPVAGGTNRIQVMEVNDTGNTTTGWLATGTGRTELWVGDYIANPTNNKAFNPLAQNSATHQFRVHSGTFDTRNATNQGAIPVILATDGMELGNVILLVNTNARGHTITNSPAATARRVKLNGIVRANAPFAPNVNVTSERFTHFGPTNYLDNGTNVTMGVIITNGANSVLLGVTTGGNLTTNGVALNISGGSGVSGSQTPWTNSVNAAYYNLNNLTTLGLTPSDPTTQSARIRFGATDETGFDLMRPANGDGETNQLWLVAYDEFGEPLGGTMHLGTLNAEGNVSAGSVSASSYIATGGAGLKFYLNGDTTSGLYQYTATGTNDYALLSRNVSNLTFRAGGVWATNLTTQNLTNSGALTNTGAMATAGGTLLNGGMTNNGTALFSSGVTVSAGQQFTDVSRGNFRWSGTDVVNFGNPTDLRNIKDINSRSNYAGAVVATNGVTLPTFTFATNVTTFIFDLASTNQAIVQTNLVENLVIGFTNRVAGIQRSYTLTLGITNGGANKTVTFAEANRWPQDGAPSGAITITNGTVRRFAILHEGASTNETYISTAVFK